LADTLTIARRAGGFSLRVRHEDASERGAPRVARAARAAVPRGADNLVLRAARCFARETGIRAGARFTLVKRIPARAGLGGGSADAAATLVGLRALHGIAIPRARLMEMAGALGSDVPFAVRGGTALGLGRGERLRALRPVAPFRALVVVPAWSIETRAAF